MTLSEAVDCIEYAISVPEHLNVAELIVDPVQTDWPNED